MSIEATPASADALPATVSTDVFSTATARCTRRAWDVFLRFRHDPVRFEGSAVRGRITAASSEALAAIQAILREQGGLDRMSVFEAGLFVEFTAPLAVVQHVIRHPGLVQFDAIRAD